MGLSMCPSRYMALGTLGLLHWLPVSSGLPQAHCMCLYLKDALGPFQYILVYLELRQ